MNEKDGEIKKITKKEAPKIIFFVFYLIFLLYLFFLLTDFRVPLFIIVLLLLFLLLLVIGPLLNGLRKSYYSRLFPKKGKQSSEEFKKTPIRKKPPDIRSQDIEFEYRKPLLRTCRYCGMTVANFADKCPQCGKPIMK
ncbi:MAG: hypothetical protein JW891_02875 [Candidatus Lokiarchaeota archaeon]|nr:hypothetical protein [Candidatus Lokiarchaeota archaeon]